MLFGILGKCQPVFPYLMPTGARSRPDRVIRVVPVPLADVDAPSRLQ